jgi:hypothetical protein
MGNGWRFTGVLTAFRSGSGILRKAGGETIMVHELGFHRRYGF